MKIITEVHNKNKAFHEMVSAGKKGLPFVDLFLSFSLFILGLVLAAGIARRREGNDWMMFCEGVFFEEEFLRFRGFGMAVFCFAKKKKKETSRYR